MAHFDFEDTGMKDYKDCWDYQEALLGRVQADKQAKGHPTDMNRFLLVEHPHVYTLGKSGDTHNLLINEVFLNAIGASFYRINRGGDITYHGPGQLVGYPVIDLDYYKIGVRAYISKTEEAIIAILGHYGICGARKEGATGVWLDPGRPDAARKICAIGVRVSRGVTMHGFALNVNTDMRYFDYINPCGFSPGGVTSIERETGSFVDMDEVKKLVMTTFNKVF